MLFNRQEIDISYDSIVNDNVMRDTVAFDFETNTFPIVDGSPVIVSGLDSLAEFVKNFIHVTAGEKAVYDDDYGASIKELIGKRHKDGFEMSRFFERVKASAKKCESIDSVEGFVFEDDIISFRVRLKTGESLIQSFDLGGDF